MSKHTCENCHYWGRKEITAGIARPCHSHPIHQLHSPNDWCGEWIQASANDLKIELKQTRKCRDCCNYQEPSFLDRAYGNTDLRCMTKPPWIVRCRDPDKCSWYNKKPREQHYTTVDGPNDDIGYQDESRTETATEQIYDTRWDCPIMPGEARLVA